MIKVIHVITDKNIGGAGRWLLNYIKYCNKNQFKITVLLPTSSELEIPLKALKVEIITLDTMTGRSFEPKCINGIKTILKQGQYDVLHTHASLSARIAGKIAGTPCIIHTRHCLNQVSNKPMIKWFKAVISNHLSHKIIAISQSVKENMMDEGIKEDKIHLIYNGIDFLPTMTREEKQIMKGKYRVGSEEILVGIVARLEAVKGHEYFIEAAEGCVKDHLNVKFLIVGTGTREKELKALVQQKNLQSYILFTGYLENVDNIMNILDINVISSISEALCLSLIEGMSLKKPSIGTDAGGVSEVIDHNITGLLTESCNSDALYKAMKKLILDEQLRIKMGEAGFKKAEDLFKASKMAKKIESLYLDVLRKE